MTHTSLRLLGLSASLALPLSAQTVTTLLDDAFTDADRTNQSLPSSARWLTSGTNSTANIDASGGALFNKATVTNLAYFTTAGAPVALAVGESLTLTFEVSFSAVSNSAAAFRVGFYNSGSRLAADNFGNGAPEFSAGYAGYFGGVNTAATSNNIFRYYERGTSTTLIGGSLGTAGYVQTGGNFGGAFKVFATNSVYTAQLVLTRTGETSLNLSQSYTGVFSGDSVSSTVSGSINDTSGLTTSFDTLAFLNNTSGANFTLDNVRLDYLSVSTIPEPSSAAALAGALVLSAGALRRRRRA